MPYAKGTTVDISTSKAEIEDILLKYGCDDMVMRTNNKLNIGYVMFEYAGRAYRFEIEMPNREEFKRTPKGRVRDKAAVDKAWRAAGKERWRALKMFVYMTLEAIELGIVTFEQVMMPFMLTDDSGETIYEKFAPEIKQVKSSNGLPTIYKMLGPGRS